MAKLVDTSVFKKFEPLDVAFLRRHNILKESKLQIIEDQQDEEILIGAKGCGKTIVAELATLIQHEQHPKFHSIAFRKYEYQATQHMGDNFIRALNLVRHYGYEPRYQWDRRKNRTYALFNDRDMEKNSFQSYTSLENESSTDGLAITNLGYYGAILIDEPIVKEDMLDNSKIPSPERWKATMEYINSNVERFNASYATLSGLAQPKTRTWFMMNDYGSHPLSVFVESRFPQNTFVKAITGYEIDELLGNAKLIENLCRFDKDKGESILDSKWAAMWLKTSSMRVKTYNEVEGKTVGITRFTLFDNPENVKDARKIIIGLAKIAEGFLRQNWRLLAINAGLQFKSELDSGMLVYNIKKFNVATMDEINREGYVMKAIAYAVDIDTSRVFTVVPVFWVQKSVRLLQGKYRLINKIFVDKIIELPSVGAGDYGENHNMSADEIARLIKKHTTDLLNHRYQEIENTYIIVDDDRKFYLKLLKDRLGDWYNNYSIPIKNGEYDIIARQDYVENGIKNEEIVIHPANTALINDIKTCIKESEYSPKRKTTGNSNYLDRIDAMEYGIYPFVWILQRSRKINMKPVAKENGLNYG